MKTNILKSAIFLGLLVGVVACSTKRNSFLSRNSHALSTEYNILYNGDLALEAGINELRVAGDNFWELLPVEPMQPKEENMMPGQTKNANFERAETKAIKAIQKHSMNIGGSEKNPQMDEAHLMLGKARYYDNRFVPALEAFNYILYKYPSSDKIYEAKVWREKTNIRLENDQLAVNNLNKLLKEIKFKDQIFADANAILAEAFLNLEQKDSAVSKIKLASQYTKRNDEKARYRFILGQLYEELGYKDSAYATFQQVIDMKRKSPRQYVVHAHARQAMQFDFKSGDTIAFLKKYEKLLKDRENRPYLGSLNHQLALFYDKKKDTKTAEKFYKNSLKYKNEDTYLIASNYRNLADIYFDRAKYITAGQYYDSTLVQLNPRSREHKAITRKRENLVDVIKYEGIARANDSILQVIAMSPEGKTAYYEKYIAQLKKDDEARKLREEIAGETQGNRPADRGKSGEDMGAMSKEDVVVSKGPTKNSSAAPAPAASNAGAGSAGNSNFYFYNPTTVAFGKAEFRKNWGNRPLVENWRVVTAQNTGAVAANEKGGADAKDLAMANEIDNSLRYSPDFYIGQLPTEKRAIDSIGKERNFAYYQLGAIYKEKFREYTLASDKLEALLNNNPEERLILPSMYNLYKIYEITNATKAEEMKTRIISQYPTSRYAQILSNANSESVAAVAPEVAYDNLFKQYMSGDYKKVLANLNTAIDQFAGDEIISKLELLKAHTIGKLRGVEEYQKALNFVALNYPNSPEGKNAESLLGKEIPALAALQFSSSETASWKILYRAPNPEAKNIKYLQEKIKKFLADREITRLTTTLDLYTETDNFVVIHGSKSEDYAKGIASILKEFKEYKVPDQAIIISGQNYEVVQIKKNIDAYLNNPTFVPISVTQQLPFTAPVKEVAVPAVQKQPAKAVQQSANPAAPVKGAVPGTNPVQGTKGQQQRPGAVPGQQLSQPGMPPMMQPQNPPKR